MAEVREDVAFVDGDACGREEATVFGLRDERADDRDAGRVGGDGWLMGSSARKVIAGLPM